MGNLNYIVFGGVDSRDYGIYISGEGVFNAPERDVEVVNIPGKDGDLLIDRGRFLNIEVTYPGFNFEPDLSTFAERLRAFRAALASQVGYQRLEDSFHPDEFRLASFRSGLDINPVMYNTASTFDIAFDCKPQRFLKSGEEEITIGEWGETQTVSGSIATFEAESNTGIKSLVANIEPIQSGTGDPSPTNVRLISGWSGVNIEQSGKNLIDMGLPYTTASSGATNHLATGFTLPKAGTWIRCSGKCSDGTALTDVAVVWLNGDTQVWNIGSNRGFQVPSNINEVTRVRLFTPATYAGKTVTEFQIEYVDGQSSTATAYEPYQGSFYSIPLGQTVYVGVLDVVSGKLVIDRGYVDLGTLSWDKQTNATKTFYRTPSEIADMKKSSGVGVLQGLLCSNYTEQPWTRTLDYGSVDNAICVGWRGKSYIAIADSANADLTASEFKTAMNGVQLVYKLATPIEIQLTPTEITTLDGVNNIWADSGEVSVEIGEDPNILVNPTPFEALPLFEVVGTGSLTVGNTTVTITGDSTQDIFIDSDIMEAYEDDNGAIISRNDRINLSGTDFPKLGEETRVESNGLTSVKITPRWWTI